MCVSWGGGGGGYSQIEGFWPKKGKGFGSNNLCFLVNEEWMYMYTYMCMYLYAHACMHTTLPGISLWVQPYDIFFDISERIASGP